MRSVAALALACCVGAKHTVTIEKELIAATPQTAYSHVCSMTERQNGDVVATWQGGSKEKSPDSSMWSATRSEATGSWSTPSVAVRFTEPVPTCVMNGVQWQDPDNPDHLTLVYHVGGGQNGECFINHWVPYVSRSTDGGLAWGGQAAAVPLSSLTPAAPNSSWIMGPVKNQCVRLSNGEVLCPSSNESDTQDTSHFETTDAAMRSWTKRSDITLRGPPRPDPDNCMDMIQPVVFEKKQKGERA